MTVRYHLEPLAQRLPPALWQEALTHPSWRHEEPGSSVDNQRLEFLGDAVLGLVVAEWLYQNQADWDEGFMTQIRAGLVNEANLARVASRIGLGEHLRLGRGVELEGGRERPSILADALEALVGASYLELGLVATRRLVWDWLQLGSVKARSSPGQDYKSQLQETAHRLGYGIPKYTLVSREGPDHSPRFCSRVTLGDRVRAEGCGRSKRGAEKEAARLALEQLPTEQDSSGR
ncbi:MAG: ribonuclease III [Bacillota bacterium]